MTPADNPYAPPPPNRETEETVSQQTRVIVKADLFTKLCFAVGSVALPIGVGLIATYGFANGFATSIDSFERDAAIVGTIAVGLSVGLLLLAICQMKAKNKAANRGRTKILNPADRP